MLTDRLIWITTLKSQELMIWKIAKKSKNVSERLSILFLENMGGATAKIPPHLWQRKSDTLIREIVQNFQWIFVLSARMQTETIIVLFTISDIFQTDISELIRFTTLQKETKRCTTTISLFDFVPLTFQNWTIWDQITWQSSFRRY